LQHCCIYCVHQCQQQNQHDWCHQIQTEWYQSWDRIQSHCRLHQDRDFFNWHSSSHLVFNTDSFTKKEIDVRFANEECKDMHDKHLSRERKVNDYFHDIEDTKIEFQFLSDHLLVECNHSRNSFIVIVNWLSLQVNYSKRLHLLNELKVEFETVKTYIDYNKSSTDFNFMIIEHQLRDDLNVETVIIDDVAEKQNSITSFADNMMHDNAWDSTSSEESKTADDNEWNRLSLRDDSNSNFSLKKSLNKSIEVNQSQVIW